MLCEKIQILLLNRSDHRSAQLAPSPLREGLLLLVPSQLVPLAPLVLPAFRRLLLLEEGEEQVACFLFLRVRERDVLELLLLVLVPFGVLAGTPPRGPLRRSRGGAAGRHPRHRRVEEFKVIVHTIFYLWKDFRELCEQ